ncbi:hypothetical protein DL98DRAFT_538533 [Cadophora sp. DSE1049]|nr:hypothetical protein DL98DRAFT_538533 [Cadophora sp. DSE1049]
MDECGNEPEGVRAPTALGSPKTNRGAGLTGNHNPFMSNKLIMYLRELNFGTISIIIWDTGIVQRLLTWQVNAKKSKTWIPYNTLFITCNTNNTVTQALWNDNAPTLFMINCSDGTGTVTTPRHKPSETSSNAAVSRPWFGDQYIKDLNKPEFAWLYNQFMNTVDIN